MSIKINRILLGMVFSLRRILFFTNNWFGFVFFSLNLSSLVPTPNSESVGGQILVSFSSLYHAMHKSPESVARPESI